MQDSDWPDCKTVYLFIKITIKWKIAWFAWWFLKIYTTSLFCFTHFSHIGSTTAVSSVKHNSSECDSFPADDPLESLHWECHVLDRHQVHSSSDTSQVSGWKGYYSWFSFSHMHQLLLLSYSKKCIPNLKCIYAKLYNNVCVCACVCLHLLSLDVSRHVLNVSCFWRYLRTSLTQCLYGLWKQTCSTVVMWFIHSHTPPGPITVKAPPFVWMSRVIEQLCFDWCVENYLQFSVFCYFLSLH